MVSTRRRSARLRANATPEAGKLTPVPAAELDSLMERDETPKTGPQSNLDAIISTPAASAPSANQVPQFTFTVKTPSTAGRPEPDYDEMHPSKAHRSTARKPDSGLRLGFTDLQNTPRSPASNLLNNTPTKRKSGLLQQVAAPDFKFTGPESELSEEAQRLMRGLREEAAKIKEQMAKDREERARESEAQQMYDAILGRKIATPKGKAGRFSDVHMAEFRKMDSIEGHASAYRARKNPVVQSPTKSLKRSQSKAGLDEADKHTTPKKLQWNVPSSNNTSPAKRFRRLQNDDVSSSRPSTSDSSSPTHEFKSNLPRSRSGLASIATPTKASLARSASVKTLKTTASDFPRSPSTKTLAAPNTVSGSKLKSMLPTAATNLKSILRRHQPLVSDDPVKIAAGTHVASPNVSKVLPDVPKTDIDEFDPPSSTKKHVMWTPSTKNRHSIMPGPFDSPSKEPEPTPRSNSVQPSVTYPTLPNSGSPSPSKSSTGTRPWAKVSSPTIRRVHPSNIGVASEPVNPLASVSPNNPGYPHLRSGSPIRSLADLPNVPHGMSNKKRHRESDEEDEENRGPEEQHQEPKAKRQKRTPAPEATPVKQTPVKSRTPRSGVGSARSKARNYLSMSRLNQLARPKERK